MKSRFAGVITVTFADGHVETCLIKERAEKGKQHFLNIASEYGQLILKVAPKGKVKLNYKGDFAKAIADILRKKKNERGSH